MGEGLADVVEQRGPLHRRRVHPELRGQGRGDVGRFDEVTEHVLPIGRPVLKASEDPDHLRMHVGDARLEDGPLAGPLDLLFHLGHRPLVHLLDPGRVDAAVGHQLLQRQAGHLAPDGVEAGQHHGLGGVVDDQVHPSEGLEGSDVPALPADDPPLHVVGGEAEHRDRGIRGLLRRHPLDGNGDDLPGPLLALFPGPLLQLPHGGQSLPLGLVDQLAHERVLGLLGRHPSHLLQLTTVLVGQPVQVLLPPVELVLDVREAPLGLLQLSQLRVDLLLSLGEPGIPAP
jgi:hypothetical protein